MARTLEILKPYFDLRTATGRTFHRSDRRARTAAVDPVKLH
jgi:hypothetical protein